MVSDIRHLRSELGIAVVNGVYGDIILIKIYTLNPKLWERLAFVCQIQDTTTKRQAFSFR